MILLRLSFQIAAARPYAGELRRHVHLPRRRVRLAFFEPVQYRSMMLLQSVVDPRQVLLVPLPLVVPVVHSPLRWSGYP